MRPRLCIGWDLTMRHAFGWNRGSGARYVEFLSLARAALAALGARTAIDVPELPKVLGLSGRSSAQLVDDYLTITVSRGRRAEQ